MVKRTMAHPRFQIADAAMTARNRRDHNDVKQAEGWTEVKGGSNRLQIEP